MDLIAFYATFTDGSAGIYAAQVPLTALGVVPEPATLTLLAVGGAALLRRGRKRV